MCVCVCVCVCVCACVCNSVCMCACVYSNNECQTAGRDYFMLSHDHSLICEPNMKFTNSIAGVLVEDGLVLEHGSIKIDEEGLHGAGCCHRRAAQGTCVRVEEEGLSWDGGGEVGWGKRRGRGKVKGKRRREEEGERGNQKDSTNLYNCS